jgi:hypothetical protein
MIFDHENGNWKNSEIARTTLEILASQTADHVDEPSQDTPEVVDEERLVAEARIELESNTRIGASHLIINELNRIAELIGDNPRAALEIELAIDDIKHLLK